jgi:DNA invertase Pin-like site-specific DNA recombinase
MVDASLAVKAGRAAMYVRMSTEHQQYSTENQADAIRKYADQRNLSIVKTFVDHGKSGLRLASRLALIELLREVASGTAQFELILVYDVSRWGRFQDADESAYYEYVCKRSGVFVHYCAEQFENDGSMSSVLLKAIKRSMAGEYSRELSVKVFAGQSRLVELGFRQGGWAGFGLRRQLLDSEGKIKGLLRPGEQKSIQTDRVVLVPGPEEEVSIVQNIFTLFTTSLTSESGIARLLNEQGLVTDRGSRWTRNVIHTLLTSPKYIGTNIYNRTSYKLCKKHVTNPASMWIRRNAAFDAIVPMAQFAKAQELIQARAGRPSDEEMLASLRRLLAKLGKLTAILINRDRSTPCTLAFTKRFRSLTHAYALIGYKASRDYKYHEARSGVEQLQRNLCRTVKEKLRSYGASVEDQGHENAFLVNGQFTISVKVCYCNVTENGNRWSVRLDPSSLSDVTIAARQASGNNEILDYYIFPSLDRMAKRVFIEEENESSLEVYRFDTLDYFLTLARRGFLVQTK